MTALLSELPYLGIYAVALLAIFIGAELVCRRTHLTDEGSPLDRVLAGPERREYRDAS